MPETSSGPLWSKAVAGGFAGMSVDFVLFPLDTIKTRMQVRRGANASVSAGSAVAMALRSGAFYRGENMPLRIRPILNPCFRDNVAP